MWNVIFSKLSFVNFGVLTQILQIQNILCVGNDLVNISKNVSKLGSWGMLWSRLSRNQKIKDIFALGYNLANTSSFSKLNFALEVRTQESPGEPRRAQESAGQYGAGGAQESPEAPRRAQDALGVRTGQHFKGFFCLGVRSGQHFKLSKNVFAFGVRTGQVFRIIFCFGGTNSGGPRRAQSSPRERRGAQESPGGHRRAQESPGEPRRAQASPGEPRRAQDAVGAGSGQNFEILLWGSDLVNNSKFQS